MAKKIMKPDFIHRVTSVLIAVALWFFVAYAENPEMELWVRDIPVTYVNEGTLSERDLVRIKGEGETVSVKVKGDRRAILSLSASDVIATVDLSSMKEAKTYSLPITVKFPVDGLSVSDKKPYSIEVSAEDKITKEFPISVLLEGEAAENIKIEEYKASNEKVRVTGGESLINSAEGCIARLDISDISGNKTAPVLIELKMKDGTILKSSDISFSNTHTDVSIKVRLTKEVPVEVVYEGGSGEIVKSTKVQPEKIKISGEYEEISQIKSIKTMPVSVSRKYETEKITALIDFPDSAENSDGVTSVAVEATISKDSVENEQADTEN